MLASELPLLPLILDQVPPGLVQVLAQEGIPFRQRAFEGAMGRFVLFDSRIGLPQPPGYGQVAIDIDPLRAVSDEDPFDGLIDDRVQLHQWEIAGWDIVETIGRTDRNTLRRRILDALRRRIEQAGGIWLCVSPFPFPYHSVFNFRIDHPEFEPADFETTLQTIADDEQAVSHFVDPAIFASHPEALRRLGETEVGLLDVGSAASSANSVSSANEENPENALIRGMELLQNAGIQPLGCTMPVDCPRRELLLMLEKMNLQYGSQSSLGYDDMPFFLEGNHFLQVPTHPVSLTGFLNATATNGPKRVTSVQQAILAAVNHFRQTARGKYYAGEPVFFVDRSNGSLGRYPQLLQSVFDTVNSFGVMWKTTLGEFADWWRARAAVRLQVDEQDGCFLVTSDGLPKGYHVGIEYWRGKHVARMQLKEHPLLFSPTALAYEKRTMQARVQPTRIDPPEGLYGLLRRWFGGKPLESGIPDAPGAELSEKCS